MECEAYTGSHHANVSALVSDGSRGRVGCGTKRKEEREGRLSKFLTPCFGPFINLCLWSCKLRG